MNFSDKKNVSLVVLLSLILLWSFSSNPPQGRTGGPGESTCSVPGCHFGINATINGTVELSGLPNQLHRGMNYPISLHMIAERGSPQRAGFQMIALTSDQLDSGGFNNAGPSTTLSFSNDRWYWEHDPAQDFSGSDTLTYQTNWRADSISSSELVIFYYAANFADGNGGSSGDRVVAASDTFLLDPAPLNAQFTLVDASCRDLRDGAIVIDVEGGSMPYRYQWNTQDTTATLNNLLADEYFVTISDAGGDSVAIEIVVGVDDNQAPVLACVTDTIFISSCAPFSYPLPTATDNCGEASIFRVGGQGPNKSFQPGEHIEVYQAIDSAGNTALCTIYIINAVRADISIDITNIQCYSDSIGNISVEVSGQNDPFSLSIPPDLLPLDSLPEGSYTLLITDATGCAFERNIQIGRPDSLEFQVLEVKHPRTSNSGDGSIDINISGGTPPYSFSWMTEDEEFSTEEDLELLFPGIYSVLITDSQGCTFVSDSIRLDAITSSNDRYASDNLELYPNPTKGFIRIDHHDIQSFDFYEIYDVHGKRLTQDECRDESIDLNFLTPGLYLIHVTDNSGKSASRLFIKL